MAEVQTAARLGELGILVGGETIKTGATFEVRSPYDGALVATVHYARPKEIERAIADAERAFTVTRKLPSWKREAILAAVAAAITQRREELAQVIALEAGKPIKTSRLEVDRAAFAFRVAAEETKRIHGEILSLDWLPGTENREAHVRRIPLGPIAGITPFNFPLLLVAHERIKLLSFTGSALVGWGLKGRAGRKRVTLELGGNAAVIVHQDADVTYAAERVAFGGFSYAGQSCISAQRIYVHEAVYDAFAVDLVRRTKALKA